jgi:hypothetical protein
MLTAITLITMLMSPPAPGAATPDVLKKQDVIEGWRPCPPLTFKQLMTQAGEYAMVTAGVHSDGVVTSPNRLPPQALIQAFGEPLPAAIGTQIPAGYWWGEVGADGKFTGQWFVVHPYDRDRDGHARVRHIQSRPFAGHPGEGQIRINAAVKALEDWLEAGAKAPPGGGAKP